jgi:hypothetical protein
LHLIVAPKLSGGWQHNYSPKTSQAGHVDERSILLCLVTWSFNELNFHARNVIEWFSWLRTTLSPCGATPTNTCIPPSFFGGWMLQHTAQLSKDNFLEKGCQFFFLLSINIFKINLTRRPSAFQSNFKNFNLLSQLFLKLTTVGGGSTCESILVESLHIPALRA